MVHRVKDDVEALHCNRVCTPSSLPHPFQSLIATDASGQRVRNTIIYFAVYSVGTPRKHIHTGWELALKLEG